MEEDVLVDAIAELCKLPERGVEREQVRLKGLEVREGGGPLRGEVRVGNGGVHGVPSLGGSVSAV